MSLEPSFTQPAATVSHDIAGLDELDHGALRALAQSLIERIAKDSKQISQQGSELQLRQAKIDALTVEIRLLRHLRFSAKTEAMDAVQVKLFEEANAEDLAAAQQQLAQLGIKTAPAAPKKRPVSCASVLARARTSASSNRRLWADICSELAPNMRWRASVACSSMRMT